MLTFVQREILLDYLQLTAGGASKTQLVNILLVGGLRRDLCMHLELFCKLHAECADVASLGRYIARTTYPWSLYPTSFIGLLKPIG